MTKMSDLAAAKRFLEGMSGGARPTPVLAAVSGGLDSMCLLHLLATWGRERNMAVTAAHFNHRLRGAAADRDEAFVREWCAANGVPFVSGHGDVGLYAREQSLSVEEAARTLRYAFLAEQQRELDCTFVLTAHHADDNAETMLLNLLRGAGLRGLSGIPDVRGCIARPFLQHTRAELEAYAEKHSIPHVEDETNRLDDAARNVLRHQVLPVLRELNPRAVENMSRTAELLARDERALERLAEELLRRGRREGTGLRIEIGACLAADRAVLSRAVHMLLARVGGHRKDLTAAHVEAVCALVYGPPGKELSLPYGVLVRREEQALAVLQKKAAAAETPIRVGERVRFGRWTVELAEDGDGRAMHLPQEAALTVTAWRREDRMTLPGSRGSRSLKRICADRGILPAERDLLPVLRVEGRPAAVPGIGLDMDFTLREEAPAVFIRFYQDIEEIAYGEK